MGRPDMTTSKAAIMLLSFMVLYLYLRWSFGGPKPYPEAGQKYAGLPDYLDSSGEAAMWWPMGPAEDNQFWAVDSR